MLVWQAWPVAQTPLSHSHFSSQPVSVGGGDVQPFCSPEQHGGCQPGVSPVLAPPAQGWVPWSPFHLLPITLVPDAPGDNSQSFGTALEAVRGDTAESCEEQEPASSGRASRQPLRAE